MVDSATWAHVGGDACGRGAVGSVSGRGLVSHGGRRGVFFWRWVGFGCRAGSRDLTCGRRRAKQGFWLDEGWRTFSRRLRVGRGRAGFACILFGADSRADSPWIGQGLLCQKSLRLDLDWSQFRRNRLGLLRKDRLRARGWFVTLANDHQDEREQDCDIEDSAHNADGDFLGFTHGLVLLCVFPLVLPGGCSGWDKVSNSRSAFKSQCDKWLQKLDFVIKFT